MTEEMAQSSFSEFFRVRRQGLGLSLRQFCLKHGLEPGNLSRLERGLLPSPRNKERLLEYARFLELPEGSEEWHRFFDLAAASKGRLPQELLEDQEIVANLPNIFRSLRGGSSAVINLPASPVAQEGEAAASSPGVGKRRVLTGLCVAVLVVSAAVMVLPAPTPFEITEAVVCREVDRERGPVGSASEFPMGTGSVACWFSWKRAPRNLPLQGRWYYVTGDRPILDVPVILTRDSGQGQFLLRMPPGNVLPSGSYRIRFLVNEKVVKTVPFAVAAAGAPVPQRKPSSVSE